MNIEDLRLIRHLLWGRTWPSVCLPPDTTIEATDAELRTLGFIPAFLQEHTPREVLAFMGLRQVDKGPADMVLDGHPDDVLPGGFYVDTTEKGNDIPGWILIHETDDMSVWQDA